MTPPRILNPEQYGATLTAYRHLRTAAIALADTDGVTDEERTQVWAVVHDLRLRIDSYQKQNNLPPEVTR